MKSKTKTSRLKITLAPIVSRDEAEALVNDIAGITLNKIRFQADADEQINQIKERFAPLFARCDAELQQKTDALHLWASANPPEWPKGRKSIKFASGILGFRDGTPKLALLNRQWTWDKALKAVQSWLPNFIRNTPEIDKEALLAQRAELVIIETLPRCGLKVTKDESFFVDPDLTQVETRQTQKAEAA